MNEVIGYGIIGLHIFTCLCFGYMSFSQVRLVRKILLGFLGGICYLFFLYGILQGHIGLLYPGDIPALFVLFLFIICSILFGNLLIIDLIPYRTSRLFFGWCLWTIFAIGSVYAV